MARSFSGNDPRIRKILKEARTSTATFLQNFFAPRGSANKASEMAAAATGISGSMWLAVLSGHQNFSEERVGEARRALEAAIEKRPVKERPLFKQALGEVDFGTLRHPDNWPDALKSGLIWEQLSAALSAPREAKPQGAPMQSIDPHLVSALQFVDVQGNCVGLIIPPNTSFRGETDELGGLTLHFAPKVGE